MHYFSNKFSKIVRRWRLFTPSTPYTFNFGDLKFTDLTKLIMTKSNFKKIVWSYFSDVITISNLGPIKISGYWLCQWVTSTKGIITSQVINNDKFRQFLWISNQKYFIKSHVFGQQQNQLYYCYTHCTANFIKKIKFVQRASSVSYGYYVNKQWHS